MIRALCVAAILAAFPPPAAAQLACGDAHLLTIDANGSVASGSKTALRRAVGAGLPVRVGWELDANADGVGDISHWADASFLSDFEGEIFAQIADIQRQQPLRGQARITMPAARQRWTGLLGTNGTLEGHFDDGSATPSVRVRSTWCVASGVCAPDWRLVYRHDADGKPVAGSKQDLLDAIRQGRALRLAWGFAATSAGNQVTVEHTSDPIFLTIKRGEHVFVQLPEHIAQTSYAEPEGARFESAPVMWRGLMGTDGTFDAVYVDRATGKEVQRHPQRAGLAWFAMLPAPGCPMRAPLELAVPGGVRAGSEQPRGR